MLIYVGAQKRVSGMLLGRNLLHNKDEKVFSEKKLDLSEL